MNNIKKSENVPGWPAGLHPIVGILDRSPCKLDGVNEAACAPAQLLKLLFLLAVLAEW